VNGAPRRLLKTFRPKGRPKPGPEAQKVLLDGEKGGRGHVVFALTTAMKNQPQDLWTTYSLAVTKRSQEGKKAIEDKEKDEKVGRKQANPTRKYLQGG